MSNVLRRPQVNAMAELSLGGVYCKRRAGGSGVGRSGLVRLPTPSRPWALPVARILRRDKLTAGGRPVRPIGGTRLPPLL
jgi:hypothetical protein